MRPISELVQPDRVHRSIYTDQEIFDREIDNIWNKIWVYCGHESQVKNKGDFHTLQIGRQPMIMVRGADDNIHVSLQSLPASRRTTVWFAIGQYRIDVCLLVSRVDVSPRWKPQGHPHAQGV